MNRNINTKAQSGGQAEILRSEILNLSPIHLFSLSPKKLLTPNSSLLTHSPPPNRLKPSRGKAYGFTLAEVLFTILIIGVVASMTIPPLMNNTQNAEFKSAWKKDFSVLSQASLQYLQENQTFLGATDYANLLQPYLKVAQYCPTHSSTEGCWVPSGSNHYLKTTFGSTIAGTPDNSTNKDLGLAQGLILNDGTTLATYSQWSPNCALAGNVCGWVIVDVNGFKAPNTVGRDVYGIFVLPDKVVPMGSNAVTWYNNVCGNGDAGVGDSGYGCSALYLYN